MKYQLINPDIDWLHPLDSVLKNRGITNISDFLQPTDAHIHSPLLLDNIEEGVQLLLTHIKQDSNILLVVDSDSDGYNSSAILWQYLHIVFPNIKMEYYVHQRKEHGVVLSAVNNNINLVIIPDAGSNQYDEHLHLKNQNIDVLVIDHHEAELVSENALIINNQLSLNYPNKALCGAGVVYKFCQVLDQHLNVNYADQFLDLVAIGLIGDMMDVRELETKRLIDKGLNQITNSFIKALIEARAFQLKDTTNITMIGAAFYIVPLINAVVRFGKYEEKRMMFEAFINGDKMIESTKRGASGTMESVSTQAARNAVNAHSRQARSKEKAFVFLDQQIQSKQLYDNNVIITTIDDTIDTNLTGLIATQLVSKYSKPVLVGRVINNESGSYFAGSGRGNDRSELKDLKAFLQDSGYFEYAEGHPNAHGVKILSENIPSFIEYANNALSHINFAEGSYNVDFVLAANDAKLPTIVKELGSAQSVWGKSVEEPLIVVTNLKLNQSDISYIGEGGTTVKIDAYGLTYIKFKDIQLVKKLKEHNSVELTILGRANLNEWNGNVTPQLIIVDIDIKPVDNYIF